MVESSGITSQNPYPEEVRVTTSFLLWSNTNDLGSWFQQLPGFIRQANGTRHSAATVGCSTASICGYPISFARRARAHPRRYSATRSNTTRSTHTPSGTARPTATDQGPGGSAKGETLKAEAESTASTASATSKADEKAASLSPSRRQVLGTDPKRGYVDYEGTVGEEIEARFGGFDRDPSGAGEWIGKSEAYKGKVFDLLGVPPGKSQFHGHKMERFLPSIDAHFLKQIDYIVLDTRNMTAAQRQAVMEYINSKWSSQSTRLIVL
jgi:hypothetical protein